MKRKSEEAGIRKEIENEGARERLSRLLRGLRKSGTMTSFVDALERAYDTVIKHKEVSADTVNDAYYVFGLRLIEVLHRVGYFGEKDKPLEYDDAKSVVLRNSASNIGFDKGLTLALYILSELKSTERRMSVKTALEELIQDIRVVSQHPDTILESVKKRVATRLQSYALSLWLTCKEPEDTPTHQSRIL